MRSWMLATASPYRIRVFQHPVEIHPNSSTINFCCASALILAGYVAGLACTARNEPSASVKLQGEEQQNQYQLSDISHHSTPDRTEIFVYRS